MMKPLAVVIPHIPEPYFEKVLLSLTKSDLVERILIIRQEPLRLEISKCRIFVGRTPSRARDTQSDCGRNPNKVSSSPAGASTNFDRARDPGETSGEGGRRHRQAWSIRIIMMKAHRGRPFIHSVIIS